VNNIFAELFLEINANLLLWCFNW